jgi:hypothetical protein
MDTPQAASILKALADGIDPYSGAQLPARDVYQHPDTVRAFYRAIAALQGDAGAHRSKNAAHKAARTGADNAGKPWPKDEDERLLAAFDAAEPVEAIAARHGRSRLAIEARLARFGRVPMPPGVRLVASRPAAAERSAAP